MMDAVRAETGYKGLDVCLRFIVSWLNLICSCPVCAKIIHRCFELDLSERREKTLYEAFAGSDTSLPADQS